MDTKMIIAFTVYGEEDPLRLHPQFGRAPAFCFVHEETGDRLFVDNQAGMEAAHGAGTRAGEIMARQQAKALITGHIGPKALAVLQAAQIPVYNTNLSTVEAAMAAYTAGELTPVTSPNPMR